MENGWIKLYRSLMSDCIWQSSTASLKVVLITLLMMANHEENEWVWQGKKFKCKPGQMVTSVASLKANCGSDVSEGAVRCALKRLENLGFITKSTTSTGTLITIVNWGKFQGSIEPNYKPNCKQTTNEVQTNYKRTTTNKNDKNDNNDKNINTASSPKGDLPPWQSEGFSSEDNYIKFLRGEISEPC